MTTFQDCIKTWPIPSLPSVPFKVEKGRSFGSFHTTDLNQFIGQLFKSTDAQAIRLTFSKTEPEFYRASIQGAGCPPVPYATLSGEHLPAFLEFACQSIITLWLHRDMWFWADELNEDELEKLTDSFIHSL